MNLNSPRSARPGVADNCSCIICIPAIHGGRSREEWKMIKLTSDQRAYSSAAELLFSSERY